MAFATTLLVLVPGSFASDNGLARLPPMGWRSWNLMAHDPSQQWMEEIMDGMVSRKRSVDGVPTSLLDLGYSDIGLDDFWQACGEGDADLHLNYHDADGNPIVNTTKFPDMKSMVDHAHSLGLTAGFYGNNCGCSEAHTDDRKFYEGDARKVRELGFDGIKLDACGAQMDMQLWEDVFKADGGPPVMVENCHWGRKEPFEPNATWCPWNFYRSGEDIRSYYASVMANLNAQARFYSRNLSTPGCWAYADMMEVGVVHGPGDASRPPLTTAESRTQFGGWVITSSPLILAHDTTDDSIMDSIWPIIANKEVLEVSQTYAGFSGGVFKNATETVLLEDDSSLMETPSYQYLYKPMTWDGSKAAVLLLNSGTDSAKLTLGLNEVPGLSGPCDVRDLWKHESLGKVASELTVEVDGHDAAFLMLSNCSPEQSFAVV